MMTLILKSSTFFCFCFFERQYILGESYFTQGFGVWIAEQEPVKHVEEFLFLVYWIYRVDVV